MKRLLTTEKTSHDAAGVVARDDGALREKFPATVG
jgi:hypothetical protein